MQEIAKYNKAIIPMVVAVVLVVAGKVGITPDMTAKDIISLVVTSGFVYLVPNKK